MKVAVVGAGITGLCTAHALLKRGHEVTVFEQHRPGNPYGSSHGRTRIVRQAYPDQFYTEILLEGHPLWHDLEAELGTKLVHEVGLLYIGHQQEPEMLYELDALRNLDVPHRVLTRDDIQRVHSHMVLGEEEIAVMTLSAGWADAPAVLKGLLGRVGDLGATLVEQRVTSLASLDGFDRLVVAAGAWVTKFFELPLNVTLQTFAYVDFVSHGPVWIEGFGDHLYGFPSEPGAASSKIGWHTHGPILDPDDPDREPQQAALEAIRECARRRFGVDDPHTVEEAGCLYTVAANDDFKVGWVDSRTLVASPCSGHGFKFGPWMGRFLADLLEGRQDLAQWPRFVF